MTMLQWTEKFAVGHETIDAQHRTLIDYINQLEGVLTTTNPNQQQREFVVELVAFIETYVQTHFQMEEQCMESYRCPVAAANKNAHRQFMNFFLKFKERYAAEGFCLEVFKELHQIASSWIMEHILKVDMQLKPCLKRN